MYTGAKKLATVSFILSIFSAIATVLLFIYFTTYEGFDFTTRFTLILYTVTVSACSVFVSWGMFNLSKDLDREYSSNSEYLHKLNKRLKTLEDRTN